MSLKPHGVIEDLGAEIGYTATTALVDWFGGGYLFIPREANPSHPIAKVVGEAAFRRLVEMYRGKKDDNERMLWLPLGYQREIDRRDRMIAALYHLGLGSKQIAGIAAMSERHVQAVRKRVEELGLLPLIIRRVETPVKTRRKSRG